MRADAILQNGIVKTLCRMCDTRCGSNVYLRDGVMVDIRPNDENPVNKGRMCARGTAAIDLFYHKDRILKPRKRRSDGNFSEISWDQAMDEISARMIKIKEKYGARAVSTWKGEALGFFQQEEYARRFAHAFGSPNYFSNDSACYASRYLGYRLVNGFYNTFPEFERADVIVLMATNPPICHMPFMSEMADSLQRGGKLVVVDTRLNPIACKADIFVRPHTGTDGALLWGLAHYLIKTDNYDHDLVKNYSVGFEAFAEYARQFTPERVAKETGLDPDTVVQIGELIARNRPRVIFYPGAGLEHQENGVNTIRVMASLMCLCGALDIPGGLVLNEDMAGRDLTLYDELPLLDQQPIGADRFPVLYDMRRECHTMTAMDYMLGNGEYPLRGIVMTGANPAVSNPNLAKVFKALSSLDLLVVNDFFMTRTTRFADYVLPAATFLERSELHYYPKYQQVALSRKIFDVPGARDEYTLWKSLADRLGFGEKYFPWKDEEAVNRWILEPTGITIDQLQENPGGMQYKPQHYKKFLSEPLATTSGKVEFTSGYLKDLGLSEIPEYVRPYYFSQKEQYPLVLQTGARKAFLYHSRHQNISRFRTAHPFAQLAIHPDTAKMSGICDGERVKVISEIGYVEVAAMVVDANDILPEVLELYQGWEKEPANWVTFDRRNDPISGFPLLKAVPVRIEKISSAKVIE
jgi:formate dehydrogenase (coenzyme F420) alpha subunit